MRTRTLVWLAALPCAVLAIAVAVAGARPVESVKSTPLRSEHDRSAGDKAARNRHKEQERYLYVTTIAQSATDPDFIAVIGADPRRADFGKIVNRVDMPKLGDELHHFGYSRDQDRLVVPGLFSNRIHVFDIGRDRKTMALRAVDEQLAADSGYIVPHGVMDMDGKFLVPMIGAATAERCRGASSRSVTAPARSSGTWVRDRCAHPASWAGMHVRLRRASEGQPRHQLDVRPAGNVRSRHRPWLPWRQGRSLGHAAAEGGPDGRPGHQQRRAHGALRQGRRRPAGVRRRAGDGAMRSTTTTTATASSTSSRCSGPRTASRSRPT